MDGAHALISWTYGADPKTPFGFNFAEIMVSTQLGAAPAWYIPTGPSPNGAMHPDSWVITVHGSNADRREFLRLIPVLHGNGLSILDITYRNDVGAPKSPDGLMHMGLTEWRDLEAAVQAARTMGAQRIFLFGASMGGQIVLQYLANAQDASHVSAVLLDSPMLGVPQMINYIAVEHRLPSPEMTSALAIHVTDLRLKEHIRQIDIVRYPPGVHPPVLLLQGTADEVMPAELARNFAANAKKSGWDIRYAEIAGAGHGAVWNGDPDGVETLITDFLKNLDSTHAARNIIER